MKASDFIIKVEFTDGTEVTLGGDGQLFIEQTDDGSNVATLDNARLDLIGRLQDVEKDAIAASENGNT